MIEVPEFLINYLRKYYNNEDISRILNGYKEKRLSTFRINRLNNIDSLDNIPCTKLNNIDAYSLNDNNFKLFDTKEVNSGNIYVQSISSMIPPLVLNPNNNDIVLDMTAAPGSKTSLLAQIMNNNGSITAVEIDKYRFERLKHNLRLLNVKNTYCINQDALKLDEMFSFNKVLLDAPCSGSGTINLNNDNLVISDKLIKNSSILQYKLLDKAIKLTKKGGTIVYSTCSILKIENEDIISSFIKKGLVKVEEISFNDLPLLPSTITGTLTICPNKLYEGFFICKLIKL